MIRLCACCALLPLSLVQLPAGEATFIYPTARKSEQADDYHGTKVADPYRWLENPDSAEARKGIEAENKLTFDFLDTIPQKPAETKAGAGPLPND